MRKRKSKNVIVDDFELTRQVNEYVKKVKDAENLGEEPPRMNDYIGRALLRMVAGVASRGNFSNYSYRDEMSSTAIEDCIKYLKNYDQTKSTKGPESGLGAYSYITRVMWFAFLRCMKKEKKQTEIREKMIFDAGIIDSISNLQDHDDRLYGNDMLEQLKSNIDDYYRIGKPEAGEEPEPQAANVRKKRVSADSLEDLME